MSDYGDYSDYGGDSDAEWMYMEDHYDDADVLAEHSCPSPAMGWVQDFMDYDPYDYWEDLAYLSDGFYDKVNGASKASEPNERKRKKTADHNGRHSKRRRKTEDEAMTVSQAKTPVVWKRHSDRGADEHTTVVSGKKQTKSVALLKDWRERFRNATGLTTSKSRELDAQTVVGDGFNVDSLQSVVSMLAGDSMDALKKIMEDKGLDPEAIEAVLEDLVAGQEREFDEADDEDDDEPQHDTRAAAISPVLEHGASGDLSANLSGGPAEDADIEQRGAGRKRHAAESEHTGVTPPRKKREKAGVVNLENSTDDDLGMTTRLRARPRRR